MLTAVSADVELEQVVACAEAVASRESELAAARRERDEAIRRAVRAGASERSAAAAARVAPSYAHRAARAGRYAGLKMQKMRP